jgi:hypothetical protein
MAGRCAEGGQAWSKAAVSREVCLAEARAADPEALRTAAPWGAPGAPAFPTLRRLQVTRPELLATLPDVLGAHVGTRYVEAMPGFLGRHAVALDPGGDLADWQALVWFDRSTGERVAVTTDPEDFDATLVESLTSRAVKYGDPSRTSPIASVTVAPLSVRYRGRVSPVLDASEEGVAGDLAAVRVHYDDASGLGPGQREELIALAGSLGPAGFARRAATTARVAKGIAEGRLPRRSTTARIVAALRDAEAGHERLCGCGCDRPVARRKGARYVDDAQRKRAARERQRAAKSQPGGSRRKRERKAP